MSEQQAFTFTPVQVNDTSGLVGAARLVLAETINDLMINYAEAFDVDQLVRMANAIRTGY